LDRDDLPRVGEIDRSEQIEVLFEQQGTRLVERHGRWTAAPWDAKGAGDHSVQAKVRDLERYLDRGGQALGAFVGGRMVGIGVVVPHLRPGIAQLAFLHVSEASRATGIGGRLCEHLEDIARAAGDATMVVSGSPSKNTVHFYHRRGFAASAEPLAELFELEPDDIHMQKSL
jgi:GNAT superfamily N-acetyltransferase